jgi:uncharacterized RDD family membrane protein YckC
MEILRSHSLPGGQMIIEVRMAASSSDPLTPLDQYAISFPRRFWAWCVDTPIRFGLGLAIVFLPMRLIVFSQVERYGSTDPNRLWKVMSSSEKAIIFILWLIATVIVPWSYTALQECSGSQATVGKRLLDLKVIDLAGRRISFRPSIGEIFRFPHSLVRHRLLHGAVHPPEASASRSHRRFPGGSPCRQKLMRLVAGCRCTSAT